LHDEKPSKGMIALEKKLTGYTNVSMLYGPVETHATPDIGGLIGEPEKNPRRKILTDPKEVRKFMKDHMQEIYKNQKDITPEKEHVLSFLSSNDDQNVLNALQRKKLSSQQRLAMEGKLTNLELETQLFQHMKNTSAPRIDGFTVAWVKEFWPNLCDLCEASVNDCFDKKTLTSLLGTAIMKILRRGRRAHWKSATTAPSPSSQCSTRWSVVQSPGDSTMS
jgi:hypothetical protein